MNLKKLNKFLNDINDDIYKFIRIKIICLIAKKKKYDKIIMNYNVYHNKLNITLFNSNITYVKRFTPFYNNYFYIFKDKKYFKYKILYLDRYYISYFKSDEKNFEVKNMFINDFMDFFYNYLSSLTQKKLELYFKHLCKNNSKFIT